MPPARLLSSSQKRSYEEYKTALIAALPPHSNIVFYSEELRKQSQKLREETEERKIREIAADIERFKDNLVSAIGQIHELDKTWVILFSKALAMQETQNLTTLDLGAMKAAHNAWKKAHPQEQPSSLQAGLFAASAEEARESTSATHDQERLSR